MKVDKRKQFLFFISDAEKDLFTSYAQKYKWSLAKFLRISAKTFIILSKNKNMFFKDALFEAEQQDKINLEFE